MSEREPATGQSDSPRRVLRCLVYVWAFPTTAIGLLLVPVALLRGGRVRVVSGVLEAHSPLIRWLLRHGTLVKGGASAITFGHVVLGADQAALDRTRSHERIHVQQAERWGPLFIPAYLLASAWAVLCRRDAYFDNFFERDARERA